MSVDISGGNWAFDDNNNNAVAMTQRVEAAQIVTCLYTIDNDPNNSGGVTTGYIVVGGDVQQQQQDIVMLRDGRVTALLAEGTESDQEDGNGCKYVWCKQGRASWKVSCVMIDPANWLGGSSPTVEAEGWVKVGHAIGQADKAAALAKLVKLNNSLIPPQQGQSPGGGERVIA